MLWSNHIRCWLDTNGAEAKLSGYLKKEFVKKEDTDTYHTQLLSDIISNRDEIIFDFILKNVLILVTFPIRQPLRIVLGNFSFDVVFHCSKFVYAGRRI